MWRAAIIVPFCWKWTSEDAGDLCAPGGHSYTDRSIMDSGMEQKE